MAVCCDHHSSPQFLDLSECRLPDASIARFVTLCDAHQSLRRVALIGAPYVGPHTVAALGTCRALEVGA
jgi:hypothetical protein